MSPRSGAGPFSSYASMVLEGRKNGRVLAILPFYRNYDAIFRHLELLAAQTRRDFDAIIVASSVSDERKLAGFVDGGKFDFGVIIVKRKEDTGSAGGYFTGEKYALEKGYSAIIIGDDDCHPADAALMEKLLGAWEGGAKAAAPECRFLMDGQTVYTNRALPFYSIIDAELVRARGLHYLPAYIGADDVEFTLRVARGVRIMPVDAYVVHPARHSIFADFERSLMYRINEMLLTVPEGFVSFMYGFAVVCPIYLIHGSPRARNGALHILRSVLLHKYGKEVLPAPAATEAAPQSFDCEISPAAKGDCRYDYSKVRGGFGKLPEFIGKVAGKRVLLDLVNNFSVLSAMMFARETWIESVKGKIALGRNSGPIQTLAKLVLFLAALPFFIGGGILVFFLSWLRKPDTRRYGLE